MDVLANHAIIEGTDKRKGSLKGRKWMSIFNIGGRFQDPRRRHKHSTKEKDQPILRPARSMDSLSTAPFPKEVSRRPAQHSPSTISPLVTSSHQPGSDVSVSTTGIGCSEYAVTYCRGTGLVSGSGGTQGTYTALDPEGLGVTGSETVQTRSPGLSTKVGCRAAMHITGPTMVTVPLHITSNLALGVLQGGGADRVIQRGREKDERWYQKVKRRREIPVLLKKHKVKKNNLSLWRHHLSSAQSIQRPAARNLAIWQTSTLRTLKLTIQRVVLFFKQEESSDFPLEDFSVCVIEEPRSQGEDDEDEDEDRVSKDDFSQETVEGIKESDDNMKEETIMDGYEEDSKEEESAILDELDDVEEDGGITECVVESVVGEEEEGEQREDTSGEKNDEERGTAETAETEVRIEKEAAEEKLPDPEEQQVCEQIETDVPNATELDEAIQKKCAKSKEATQNDQEEGVSKEGEEENHDKKRGDEQQIRIKSIDKELIEVKSGIKAMKDGEKHEGSDGVKGGVGRKLVVSKQPKFYQVKAVPVVPPKPQHCKITALTLKHQQQQRERRDADRGRENTLKVQTEGDHVCAGGQKKDGDDESEGEGKKEQPELRGGERERERRRDLDESLTRDSNRNSPLSMNFEEAVAIITMKREKEKEDEKEKERQKDWGNEVE
nr:rho GTPase-activating protein 30-like [Labrus bergylta]